MRTLERDLLRASVVAAVLCGAMVAMVLVTTIWPGAIPDRVVGMGVMLTAGTGMFLGGLSWAHVVIKQEHSEATEETEVQL